MFFHGLPTQQSCKELQQSQSASREMVAAFKVLRAQPALDLL
jgi:hypothetical protein